MTCDSMFASASLGGGCGPVCAWVELAKPQAASSTTIAGRRSIEGLTRGRGKRIGRIKKTRLGLGVGLRLGQSSDLDSILIVLVLLIVIELICAHLRRLRIASLPI